LETTNLIPSLPERKTVLPVVYFEAATLQAPAVESFHFLCPDSHDCSARAAAACSEGALSATPQIVNSAAQLKGVIA
jgi:hypothetical protein